MSKSESAEVRKANELLEKAEEITTFDEMNFLMES
jgi:hypothetical protein